MINSKKVAIGMAMMFIVSTLSAASRARVSICCAGFTDTVDLIMSKVCDLESRVCIPEEAFDLKDNGERTTNGNNQANGSTTSSLSSRTLTVLPILHSSSIATYIIRYSME